MRYRRLMWAEALELLDRAQRLHRQFFQTADSSVGPAWEPPVDLYETETGLTLLVALPGVAPDQVRVSLEPGMVRITGHRPRPQELRCATIWRMEIPYGRFERRMELPEGRYEVSHQECANGCFAIHLRQA